MRLALDSDPRILLVRSYGGGAIVVGEQRLTQPFIVFPDRLVLDWGTISIGSIDAHQAAALCGSDTEVVLLGAGEQSVAGEQSMLPERSVRSLFRARGIALECMNLGAACRTYNVLASEGRPVAAGLFP